MGENRDIFAFRGHFFGPGLVRRGIYKGDGWCKVPLISASFGPFLADQEKGVRQETARQKPAGLEIALRISENLCRMLVKDPVSDRPL